MSVNRSKTVSTEYTGNTTLPADHLRTYFFIVFTVGSGTVEFGGGGGKIPLALNGHYSPPVAPAGPISIESVGGTYVVHEGSYEL